MMNQMVAAFEASIDMTMWHDAQFEALRSAVRRAVTAPSLADAAHANRQVAGLSDDISLITELAKEERAANYYTTQRQTIEACLGSNNLVTAARLNKEAARQRASMGKNGWTFTQQVIQEAK